MNLNPLNLVKKCTYNKTKRWLKIVTKVLSNFSSSLCQGFDYKRFVFKYIRRYDWALRALFYNSRPDIVNIATFVSIK